MIVETRTHRKKIRETITVSANYTATIEMEIQTVVNLGFRAEEVRIEIDHLKQVFNVFLPTEPKLLEVIHQDYKLLSVRNQVNCWQDHSTTVRLSKRALDAVFERHRGDPLRLDVCQKNLKRSVLDR